MRKLKVRWTATYETEINVVFPADREEIGDEISGIDIPESATSTYVTDTFKVEKVTDEDGEEVNH